MQVSTRPFPRPSGFESRRGYDRPRHLEWQGCNNARDLGGLRTSDGGETLWGAVVRRRADQLTAAGWAALEAHGIRTIVDLRNEDELRPDLVHRPDGLTTLHLPLDGVEDREFWDHWELRPPPPLRPFLERFSDRAAGVVAAIANAQPGGVLFHCVGGRDRTGLIALLLLALAGVAPRRRRGPRLSDERIAAVYAQRGIEADADLAPLLAAEGTSGRDVVVAVAELPIEQRLRDGGLGDDEVADPRPARRPVRSGADAAEARDRPLTLQTFGIMFALGFVAAGLLVARRLKELGKPVDWAYEMIFARLGRGRSSAPESTTSSRTTTPSPTTCSATSSRGRGWSGSAVWWGAIGVLLWARWRRMFNLTLLDICAPGWRSATRSAGSAASFPATASPGTGPGRWPIRTAPSRPPRRCTRRRSTRRWRWASSPTSSGGCGSRFAPVCSSPSTWCWPAPSAS